MSTETEARSASLRLQRKQARDAMPALRDSAEAQRLTALRAQLTEEITALELQES